MVVRSQRTAVYAYYAQGYETFDKLRRFLIELVGNEDDIVANTTRWKGLLESRTAVPVHNGIVGVNTSCFIVYTPSGRTSGVLKELALLMNDVSAALDSHLQDIMQGKQCAVIITPSTAQASLLQPILDSVYNESDPASPQYNKVSLDVKNGQDEHQDTTVGGDTTVTVAMDDRHNPTAVREVRSGDYPSRKADAMLPPKLWGDFPWMPVPRQSTRSEIEQIKKKTRKGKTTSEKNCFGSAGQGLPAVVFRSSLPHKGPASSDGSLRLAWFQTCKERSRQPTGAIFNNDHGNANYATWAEAAKMDAKKRRT